MLQVIITKRQLVLRATLVLESPAAVSVLFRQRRFVFENRGLIIIAGGVFLRCEASRCRISLHWGQLARKQTRCCLCLMAARLLEVCLVAYSWQ